ncbi:MAG: hypothetical protein NTX38_07865, partial [Methylobacter sp.]|nr:hypothetical protein [Methylobacter sp.]
PTEKLIPRQQYLPKIGPSATSTYRSKRSKQLIFIPVPSPASYSYLSAPAIPTENRADPPPIPTGLWMIFLSGD